MKKSIILIILATIVLMGCIFYILINRLPNHQISKEKLEIKNLDIVYGIDEAPLTIYVYSRYNCVFCRKFFIEVFPNLKRDFIETGKLKLVVKLVDFSNNAYVKNSLKTAVCINKYGNFEKLDQLLLIEPEVIYTQQFNEITEEFIQKDLIIAECMLGGEADTYLLENYQRFKELKLTGTPTFILNNKIYKGFRSYPEMKKMIEKELISTLQ